jgi:hypothetical protein
VCIVAALPLPGRPWWCFGLAVAFLFGSLALHAVLGPFITPIAMKDSPTGRYSARVTPTFDLADDINEIQVWRRGWFVSRRYSALCYPATFDAPVLRWLSEKSFVWTDAPGSIQVGPNGLTFDHRVWTPC